MARPIELWPDWMFSANPRAAREVRIRRKALDLTQEELGDLIGVDRRTIGRWEKGENMVRVRNWIALQRLENELRPKLRACDDALDAVQDFNRPLNVP